MANVVYIVKSGTWNSRTDEFILYPYYYSSLKKAQNVRDRILADNKAKDIRESFDVNSYESLIESTDYNGENGKYLGRILIEKETIW